MGNISTETVRAVRDGRVRFDDFARRSWEDWQRIARYSLRRWGLVGKVDSDDVQQELLLGAWKAIARFDSGRSEEKWFGHFVVFGAITHARKRFVSKRIGPAPTFVDLDKAVLRLPTVMPHDGHVHALQLVERACSEPKRRGAVVAFMRHGCLAKAAAALYDDPRTRLNHRFVSRGHARCAVRRHVELAVRRVRDLGREAAA